MTIDRLNIVVIEAIVRAVAEINLPRVGPCDDIVCPFDCGFEEFARETHATDCPVTLAKMLLE